MKELTNRETISELVHAFYASVRADEVLGPIFERHIAEEEWPAHLEKLTDFWEMNLLGTAKFRGSPTKKHVEVDQAMDQQLEQFHFGRWLQLWFATIDDRFEGELAFQAKEHARKMAHGQFFAVWRSRQK